MSGPQVGTLDHDVHRGGISVEIVKRARMTATEVEQQPRDPSPVAVRGSSRERSGGIRIEVVPGLSTLLHQGEPEEVEVEYVSMYHEQRKTGSEGPGLRQIADDPGGASE